MVIGPSTAAVATACGSASAGLISLWSGEGNAADALGSNHAAAEGGVSYVPGKRGSAFSFDGVDGDLLVPASASLQLETAFTLELWFSLPFDNVPGSPGRTRGNSFISKDWTDTLGLQNSGPDPNNGGEIELGFNSPRLYSVTKDWYADVWNHVALTYDNGLYHLYVNGILESTLYRNESLLGDNEDMYFSHIGATTWNPPAWFAQRLDEIAVYGRALTAQEVADRAGLCTPAYNFTGFFQPVDNVPTVNSMNAGRAVPIKFSLDGDHGLDVIAAGYPKSEQIPCGSLAEVDGVEETLTAGGSSLSYSTSDDRYTYVWKTNSAWAGTCRQFVLKLADGNYYRANFELR